MRKHRGPRLVLLIAALCMSLVLPTAATVPTGFQAFARTNLEAYDLFTDIDQTQWYGDQQEGVVRLACELDILHGVSPTTFHPQGALRLNEAVTIASTIHSIYTGQPDAIVPVQGAQWAEPYLAYAEANGILQPEEFSDYNRPATRGEMARLFAHCLPQEGLAKINSIFSIGDVDCYDTFPVPYAEEIFQLYRAGVLAGDPETHNFRPDDTITRAEAAAIVTRLALPETRKNFDILSLYGFTTDDLPFSLTNAEGKTLHIGQRPYQELKDFLASASLQEILEHPDAGEQDAPCTISMEIYDSVYVKYIIDKSNPRTVYVMEIATSSPDYADNYGVHAGFSAEALKACYPDETMLSYSEPHPEVFIGYSSYSYKVWGPEHYNTLLYKMSTTGKGTITELSARTSWR